MLRVIQRNSRDVERPSVFSADNGKIDDDDAFLSAVFPGCNSEGADVEVRKWRTGERSDHETFLNFLSKHAVD